MQHAPLLNDADVVQRCLVLAIDRTDRLDTRPMQAFTPADLFADKDQTEQQNNKPGKPPPRPGLPKSTVKSWEQALSRRPAPTSP